MRRYDSYLLIILFCFLGGVSVEALPSQEYSLNSLPIAFTRNEGQTASEVSFTTHGSGWNLFFTPESTTCVLSKKSIAAVALRVCGDSLEASKIAETYQSFAVACRFLNTSLSATVEGENRLPWNNNYFIGNNPTGWRTNVSNYGSIRYSQLYPGIDLLYYSAEGNLKYDFVIKPDADPSQILIQYDFGGKDGTLQVNGDGVLVVSTPLGKIMEKKPFCYQTIDGNRQEVAAKYEIVNATAGTFRFLLGEYDKKYELIIDPELLFTYTLGGNMQSEYTPVLSVDNESNIYISGETLSEDFPVTPGVYDETYNGQGDVFLTKISSDGKSILYSTFIGSGSSDEKGIKIEVDETGCSYILVNNANTGFPVVSENVTGFFGPPYFLVKISSDGSKLVYSKPVGNDGNIEITDMILDKKGNILMTGSTDYRGYPVTQGAYDTSNESGRACFVVKFNNDAEIIYATYLGGGYARGIQVLSDLSDNIYVMGYTFSNFPVSQGAFDTKSYSTMYANNFITKFSEDLSSIIFSTLFFVTDKTTLHAIALDTMENVYLTGSTSDNNFPTTEGTYDRSYDGGPEYGYDGFLAKLNANGTGLIFSTYFGSENDEFVKSMVLDSNKNPMVLLLSSGGFYEVKEFDSNGQNILNSDSVGTGTNEITGFVVDANDYFYLANDFINANEYGIWSDIRVFKYIFEKEPEIVNNEESPASFSVKAPYPNPFNPSTILEYSLTETARVSLTVYSITGQKMATLVDGQRPAGSHRVLFNGANLASGMYFYRLEANAFSKTGKMLLLK